MNELDNTSSVFEHIKNRLPTGFGLGDDNENGKYKHKVFDGSLREDVEGDVSIKEVYFNTIDNYSSYAGYNSEIQITVVCKQGNKENAKNYLKKALANLRKDKMSTYVWMKACKHINTVDLGKNSKGNHMITMNINIKYLLDEEEV